MADPRFRSLAEVLVGHSCRLRAGEKILIEAVDVPHEFTSELVRLAHEIGAIPSVSIKSQEVLRELLLGATERSMDLMADGEAATMSEVDAYIGVRGSANVSELSDVPAERMKLYEARVWQRVHLDLRVARTRWVVLRWPGPSMAQLARQSTAAFEDFYFRVCTMDYARLSRELEPLRELVERTDRVRVVAPDTELEFSIAGIPAVACDGRHNIPDGEVFTAPVRDSVNGVIRFNAPTLYQGVTHEDVRLEFREGRIESAVSSNPDHLRAVLDVDEGARYVGEFALGCNPLITAPMNDILFDEKIAGSIHLTPGNAYDTACNGNRSQVHWDLVLMMDERAGGGEIYFDDVLVRKDGLFVTDDLRGLNPESLVR
ncbi:MAG: aminopeptidase [Gemmatimonadota bacterium]